MARGRFISKEICVDMEVNKLSSPWSMLAFTWLITHADREGRTYGDPSIVKSLVFPRLDNRVTSKEVEDFIKEWNDLGLIIWYEVGGDKFIQFPNFEKHQLGMKKEREPVSSIPEIDAGKHPEDCRKIAGINPAEVKLIEVNKREDKVISAPPNFYDSRPVLESNYVGIWFAITGKNGMPASDQPKIIEAIDKLRPRYKTEEELIAYLKPYWEYWLSKKTKDGRPFSKSNAAWLFDWAVMGEPLPSDKKSIKKPDPDCPKCNGLGMYSAGITNVKDKRFGSLIPCDCLREVTE